MNLEKLLKFNMSRKPNPPKLPITPERERLLSLIDRDATNYADVSRAIGKNHSFIFQFITRHCPRALKEKERESLGRHFNVDPDMFRPGPYQPKPATPELSAAPQPPQFTADDLLENALDLVERAIQRHHTPLSPAMIAYLVKGICNLAISGNLESEETQTGAHLNKFQTTGR